MQYAMTEAENSISLMVNKKLQMPQHWKNIGLRPSDDWTAWAIWMPIVALWDDGWDLVPESVATGRLTLCDTKTCAECEEDAIVLPDDYLCLDCRDAPGAGCAGETSNLATARFDS
jgi:hypothetical protein